jgi:hypothetical protein
MARNSTNDRNDTRQSSFGEAAMHSFKALLSGSQPLSKALWGYLILGGFLVVPVASSVIAVIVIMAFPAARIGAYVTGFAVNWCYLFFVSIGTWRSANQARKGRLRILAKVVVVVVAASLLVSFFRPNGVIDMVRVRGSPENICRKS